MGKTFLELKNSIKAWLIVDQEDSDERLPDQILTDLINWACTEYCRVREHQFSEASYAFQTESYQPAYTRASDHSKTRKLWFLNENASNGNNRVTVLTYLEKDPFDVKFPQSALLEIDGAANLLAVGGGTLVLVGGGTIQLSPATLLQGATGVPTHWTMWKDKFILGPAPGPTNIFPIFVDYYKFLSTLTQDTDHNIFTDKADQYIIFKALADAELFGIEDERIPLWQKRLETLEAALDLESSRQSTVPRRSQSREPG